MFPRIFLRRAGIGVVAILVIDVAHLIPRHEPEGLRGPFQIAVRQDVDVWFLPGILGGGKGAETGEPQTNQWKTEPSCEAAEM